MGAWVGQRSGIMSRAAPAASSRGGEAWGQRRRRRWSSGSESACAQMDCRAGVACGHVAGRVVCGADRVWGIGAGRLGTSCSKLIQR